MCILVAAFLFLNFVCLCAPLFCSLSLSGKSVVYLDVGKKLDEKGQELQGLISCSVR